MSKEYTKEDEIDLIELFQTVWNGRKTVLKFVVVFFLLGLFIAIFSPKEFTAKTIVVPQTEGKSGGKLGGLAAMAGVNIGGGGNSSEIPTTLYPKVVKSVPFLKELIKVPLKFEDLDKEVTYQEYYKNHQKFNLLGSLKKYTIGLPGVIFSTIKRNKKNTIFFLKEHSGDDDIYRITPEENSLFQQIGGQLDVKANDKEGFVSLSFSMPEAEASAKMLQKAQQLLQNFITEFKVNKAKEQLTFIEERYKDAKKEFDKRQYGLSDFRDRNQGLSTSRSQVRLQRLQSDYNLAFGVYSELAKKMEAQKIRVKENTPVFTVIEPVSVPVEKSRPKRGMILAIWLFLGVVLGVGVVFGKEWLKNFKNK